MNVDEEISLEWARIPHFYYDYYVYYATGFTFAPHSAGRDYLGFLSGRSAT